MRISLLSHLRAKCGGNRHFVSRYITILANYVILQNHIIKGPHDFMEKPLTVSHHPTKFGGLRYCGSVDIMYLVAEE